MLDNTITIQTDIQGTPTAEVFTRFQEFLNRTIYVGATNSLVSRCLLSLFRTAPKKVGNFNGVAKSAAKFTQDIEVPGVDSATTLTSPIIFELSCSIPVGATDVQSDLVRQRVAAFILEDDNIVRLNDKLEV